MLSESLPPKITQTIFKWNSVVAPQLINYRGPQPELQGEKNRPDVPTDTALELQSGITENLIIRPRIFILWQSEQNCE